MDYQVDISKALFWASLEEEGHRHIVNNLPQNMLVHSRACQISARLLAREGFVTLRLANNGTGKTTTIKMLLGLPSPNKSGFLCAPWACSSGCPLTWRYAQNC